MFIKRFQHAGWILILHASIASAHDNLRKNSNPVQELCLDLSSKQHGQFGKRTIEIDDSDNAEWLLGYDEVENGPCRNKEQILNNREMIYVTYCRLAGTGTLSDGYEYEMQLPRYLDNYLDEKGAGRGKCMSAMSRSEIASSPSYGMGSAVLCFDLEEYGAQTIEVAEMDYKWFLHGKVVTSGPCKKSGEMLDRREIEMETFCKKFGSARDGYEYEISAPRFLSDHLREIKGAERGKCSDDESGSVTVVFVQEYFTSTNNDDGGKELNNSKLKRLKPANSRLSSGGNKRPKPKKNNSKLSSGGNKRPKPKRNNSKLSSRESKCTCEDDKSGKMKLNNSNQNKKKQKKRERSNIKENRNRNKNIKPNTIQVDVGLMGANSKSPERQKPSSCSSPDCVCDGVANGWIQLPYTNCKDYVQCANGCVALQHSCQDGLIFDSNLQMCNWQGQTRCGPDPSCGGKGV